MSHDEGADRPTDRRSGLRDDAPALTGIGFAVGFGGVWGLMGYTVLWQGSPFSVDRRFVGSIVGTLVLLPVRLVLWGIRAAEALTGRTFDLADANRWIGVVASALGAAIAVGAFLAVRTAWRRLAARSG
jgi:hypothetical protein